jgi:hypothetical protein
LQQLRCRGVQVGQADPHLAATELSDQLVQRLRVLLALTTVLVLLVAWRLRRSGWL